MTLIDTGILDLNLYENGFKELPLMQRLDLLIATCKMEPEHFEKLEEEIDLPNELYKMVEELEKNSLSKEIEDLITALRTQVSLYDELKKYFFQTVLFLHLAESEKNEVNEEQRKRTEYYLEASYDDPVQHSPIFFDILDKLIYDNKSSYAVDLCKKSYIQIATSDDFLQNPKNELAYIILEDEFQNAYIRLKNKMTVDWISFKERIKSFDLDFSLDELKRFEKIMLGQVDHDQMAKTFKNETLFVLMEIKLAYCCHMYDLDGTSFVTSWKIASLTIEYLFWIPGREKCPLHTFFKIKEDHLFAYTGALEKEWGWFSQLPKLFAFLGGLPLFYLGLVRLGILEMKTVEEALPFFMVLKTEFKKIHSGKALEYNFIKKLEAQANLLASPNS